MDIKKIQKQIDDFANERDWKQFHNPKNLSMALSVEASELLEIFQWMSSSESFEIVNDQKKFENVSDELADILVYVLRLADILKVDIEESIKHKMEKNAKKYPVNLCKGKSKKYSEYDS